MTTGIGDRWLAGDAYEAYMGRWSRRLARTFVEWLQAPRGADWLEVGCGTGALTSAICECCEPASVAACDPSAAFVEHARAHLADPRVSFAATAAEDLPRLSGGFGVAVSGLVLNFMPDAKAAVIAMRDRLGPGGIVSAYVWDYGGGMEFLRCFWDEAAALDPDAAALDEGKRFPLCNPSALASIFREARLGDVESGALEILTEFNSFDDYWGPFLQGTGPAPAYVASLVPDRREMLRRRLERRLETRRDGLRLRARAWCIRGVSEASGA
jgi:SAM-dependent methyltransferase